MQLDYDMVTSGGLNLIKLKLMPNADDAKLKINSDQSFVFSSLAQILVTIKIMI
jgi:hypothetical protein